jgi:acetyl-CoA carboxylase biotin carboxyl carrier protein
MNIKDLRQLVKLMVDSDLSEVDITDGEHNRIYIKRSTGEEPTVMVAPHQAMHAMPPAAPVPGPASAPASPEGAPGEPSPPPAEDLLEVRSPMVGTYYSAPSPDSEAYVSVGSAVSDDTVVCIVEAMKVMNEIKAECAGTIAEVCVSNAQPVEFGQVLFRVKPA